MPRNPAVVKLAKVETTRDTVRRVEAMLADARKDYRRALLGAREAGVTLAELARRTGSSSSRIIENVRRAQAEGS